MEEKISGIEYMIEKMNIIFIENIKSKIFLTHNIQEIWDTMKTPTQRILCINKERVLDLRTKNIFQKLYEKIFLPKERNVYRCTIYL